ncbi:hypothetical protein L873DRAFT_1431256 [Choiromyces venosus 120613-1]|uniref:Uncharacterized protein n=1 Tax=Choiromyces venosus 120613-1 TaxID=1336337 RepID=A0A3N4JCW9_9PEZI|nr:hypothetical protein L873DRAFT_1431256 [Choiromyces venosus 120613-1]
MLSHKVVLSCQALFGVPLVVSLRKFGGCGCQPQPWHDYPTSLGHCLLFIFYDLFTSDKLWAIISGGLYPVGRISNRERIDRRHHKPLRHPPHGRLNLNRKLSCHELDEVRQL